MCLFTIFINNLFVNLFFILARSGNTLPNQNLLLSGKLTSINSIMLKLCILNRKFKILIQFLWPSDFYVSNAESQLWYHSGSREIRSISHCHQFLLLTKKREKGNQRQLTQKKKS